MKNFIKYLVFVLVAGALAFFIFRSCERKKEFDDKVRYHEHRYDSIQRDLDSLKVIRDAMRRKMKEDSVQRIQDSTERATERVRYAQEVRRLNAKLAAVNFAGYQAPQLDSVVAAIHPSTNDTLYSLPIDAARAVIEDAAKLPIVEEQLEVAGSRIVELEQDVTGLEQDLKEVAEDCAKLSQNADQMLAAAEAQKTEQAAVIKAQKKELRRRGVVNALKVGGAFILGLCLGALGG